MPFRTRTYPASAERAPGRSCCRDLRRPDHDLRGLRGGVHPLGRGPGVLRRRRASPPTPSGVHRAGPTGDPPATGRRLRRRSGSAGRAATSAARTAARASTSRPICTSCGNQAQVPFKPRMDKPVYCSDCFRAGPPRLSAGALLPSSVSREAPSGPEPGSTSPPAERAPPVAGRRRHTVDLRKRSRPAAPDRAGRAVTCGADGAPCPRRSPARSRRAAPAARSARRTARARRRSAAAPRPRPRARAPRASGSGTGAGSAAWGRRRNVHRRPTIAIAPAEQPATTAPRACASVSAAPSGDRRRTPAGAPGARPTGRRGPPRRSPGARPRRGPRAASRTSTGSTSAPRPEVLDAHLGPGAERRLAVGGGRRRQDHDARPGTAGGREQASVELGHGCKELTGADERHGSGHRRAV